MADIELLTTRHAKEIIDNDNKNKNEIISNDDENKSNIINEIAKVQENSFIDLLFSGKVIKLKQDTIVRGKGILLSYNARSDSAYWKLDGVKESFKKGDVVCNIPVKSSIEVYQSTGFVVLI